MYWSYYKDKDKIIHPINIAIDFNPYMNLEGRKASEMYVPQKYATYKEEILRHIPMRHIQNWIVVKLKACQNSETVKRTLSWNSPTWPYYNIEPDVPITQNHILSVILYCDFDKYQTEFSSTFRKLNYEESFESVKNRNREFWFQSKYLRETVQVFGSMEDNKVLNDGGFPQSWFDKGPYFSGLNRVVTIPQFALQLHSPTSTTKQIEVSANFAGRDGMVLQFNRGKDPIQRSLVMSFDCSWLSRYPDEDERLFMFGTDPIFVQSVQIIETAGLCDFTPLIILDCLLSGTSPPNGWTERLSEEHARSIAAVLEKDKLLSSPKVSPFLANMFRSYYRQKTHIDIKLSFGGYSEKSILRTANFSNEFTVLLSRITESIIRRCAAKDFDPTNVKLRYNLISSGIFRMFPYCRSLHILTNFYHQDVGDYSYPFNMHHFLINISQSLSWKTIEITHILPAHWEVEENWISKTWRLLSHNLIKAYASQQLKIQFESSQMEDFMPDKTYAITKFIILRQKSFAKRTSKVSQMERPHLDSTLMSLYDIRHVHC